MASPVRRVLLVEDDAEDALLIRELLAESVRTRFDVEWIPTFAAAVHAITEDRHDVYLFDYNLGAHAGTELLGEVVRSGARAPVIMLTGQDDPEIDATAERLGASDFLVKGRVDAMLLERAIRYAIGRRHAELTQRFLSDASRSLQSSLDLDHTLHRAARVGLPLLGDCCLVYYAEPGQDGTRLVGAHTDPSKEQWLRIIERTYRPDPGNPHGIITRVHRTGVSARIDEIPDDARVALAQSSEQLEAFRQLGGKAGLAVPLVARNEIRGVLVFNRTTPGVVYTDEEQALAEELARRAALTMDNAVLYRRAQRATAMRDEVLAIVSHDLRNPVNTVLLSASFVLDVLPPESTSEPVRHHLAVIKRAIGRMRRLIDDLLDVTRIEAGQLAMHVEPTDVAAVVAECCEGFGGQLTSARQRLVCDLAEALPPVAADRQRLIQVLGNLVGNAVKFAPEESSIVLTARLDGDAVRLSVSDSGPGVAAADLPHLFERFWQKRKGDRSGAGLGLPIAKAIVEGHGGRIWVESEHHQGTTVSFTIPVASPIEPTNRADAAAVPARQPHGRPEGAEGLRASP